MAGKKSKRKEAVYNPILDYWEHIYRRKIAVNDKIWRLYKKLAYDVRRPGEYFYSPARAQHVIDFFEIFCRHSKGKWGGKKVELELWQKAHLAAVFGFVDIEGNRKYRESLLIVGKKNGKSLLASGVGLYLQIADGEAGPDVFAVATTRDQAKIVWTEAKRMVAKSHFLRKHVKSLVSELSTEGLNEGTFRPLASDSDTLDGLNVHGALMDEIHQWKNGKALYDIIADGTSAREQPLIYITSTAGTIREDLYDQKYEEAEMVINGYFDKDGYKDEHFIPFIYELDDRKEWTNPKAWEKANPGLGTIKNKATLAAKVEKAKQNPMLVKNLVCKEFNIRETATESWLTFEQLNNPARYDLAKLKPRYGIGGVDFSRSVDLTNATVIFMVPDDDHIYVKQMYWIPEDVFEERVKTDKVPYDLWKERGLIRTCPGNRVHSSHITKWFLEVQDEDDIFIPWLGYDGYSAEYFVQEIRDHFGESVPEAVIQGKKTLSGPMHSLKADLAANRIIYNNNPILKWCLANTSIDIDKNGNIQPAKGTSQTKRIDGMAGLLDAYVVLERHYDEYLTMI